MADTVTIYIDNKAFNVASDDNLLSAILSVKLDLPYFCWHPSMGSVGACRQCAVTQYQDEQDTRGRIIMACMTPVCDGMHIGLNNENSAVFREQVIAAMMTNHPHDCPVCAEGGECHLQDMTVMTGHSARLYSGTKRTYENQYLGEFIGHEMNRCITCYRCTRFYNDYAGGEDFGVYGSKNQVYFGRAQSGWLDSEFSGNLVEVCPTGVFTNKVFSRHYTRKWDLKSAPSICSLCSVGCNTSVGERYGSVRRVMNRYNEAINGYFLCDKGRFGIGYVNAKERLTNVRGISANSLGKVTKLDIAKAISHFRGKTFVGIGSVRSYLEASAYLKLLVGKQHFSLGFSKQQQATAMAHRNLLASQPMASLLAVEQSDFILVLGEDISQTAPRLALSVRQALKNKAIEKAESLNIPFWQNDAVNTAGNGELSPLYNVVNSPTKLDKVSKLKLHLSTGKIISLINKIIEALTGDKPVNIDECLGLSLSQFDALVSDLTKAKKPTIVSGTTLESPKLLKSIEQLMAILTALKPTTQLVIAAQHFNSVGALALLDEHTLPVSEVLSLSNQQEIDGVIVLENELALLTEQQIKQLCENTHVIVLDVLANQLTKYAEMVMPCAAVTEGSGLAVNFQGQMQHSSRVLLPKAQVQESWRWLSAFAGVINLASSLVTRSINYESVYSLRMVLAEHYPFFSEWQKSTDGNVAQESHRVSGRTAKTANQHVSEPRTTQVERGEMQPSMEGNISKQERRVASWAPGWNSNQSNYKDLERPAGKIINQPQAQYLALSYCDFSDISAKANEAEPLAILVSNWYNQGIYAQANPEFKLRHDHNRLVCSPDIAKQNHWQHGQVIACQFEHGEVLAQLECVNTSSIKKYLYLWSYNKAQYGALTKLLLASKEQTSSYQQQVKSFISDAKHEQQEILDSVMALDQRIPIHLVAGDFDDD